MNNWSQEFTPGSYIFSLLLLAYWLYSFLLNNDTTRRQWQLYNFLSSDFSQESQDWHNFNPNLTILEIGTY